MTKDDIKNRLDEGKSLTEIFSHNTKDQEYTIFKDSWPEDKDLKDHLYDVVYIPDIALLNGASGILLNCYTVQDFLREAHGCVALAKDLYVKCNGQIPNVYDILDCTDDEFKERYHYLSWDEIVSRDNGIRFLRKQLYYLYQLNWMISHGYSIPDLMAYLEDIHGEHVEDMDDESNDAKGYIPSLFKEFEERGFQGDLWASYYEFLQAEYLDWDFSSHLITRYAKNFSIHLTNRYVNDKTSLFGGLYEIDCSAIRSGEPCAGYYPYF